MKLALSLILVLFSFNIQAKKFKNFSEIITALEIQVEEKRKLYHQFEQLRKTYKLKESETGFKDRKFTIYTSLAFMTASLAGIETVTRTSLARKWMQGVFQRSEYKNAKIRDKRAYAFAGRNVKYLFTSVSLAVSLFTLFYFEVLEGEFAGLNPSDVLQGAVERLTNNELKEEDVLERFDAFLEDLRESLREDEKALEKAIRLHKSFDPKNEQEDRKRLSFF